MMLNASSEEPDATVVGEQLDASRKILLQDAQGKSVPCRLTGCDVVQRFLKRSQVVRRRKTTRSSTTRRPLYPRCLQIIVLIFQGRYRGLALSVLTITYPIG